MIYLSSPHCDSDILLCQILALVLLVSQQYLTMNIVTYFLLFLRTLIEILLSRTWRHLAIFPATLLLP